jgi:hypothetical protein
MYPYCHYIKDKETGQKILIPGCMGTAAMGIENCTCEKKILKKFKTVDELVIEVKRLQKENEELFNELQKARGIL